MVSCARPPSAPYCTHLHHLLLQALACNELLHGLGPLPYLCRVDDLDVTNEVVKSIKAQSKACFAYSWMALRVVFVCVFLGM